MIKIILLSAGVWLSLVIGFGVLAVFRSSIIALLVEICWILIPFLSWGSQWLVRTKVKESIHIYAVTSSKQAVKGSIVLGNSSVFSASKIYLRLKVSNRLTGEISESIFKMSVPAKSQCEEYFELTAKNCGYLVVEISKVYFMDWLGFLPVPGKIDAVGKVSVLPETFSSNITLRLSTATAEDAQAWSQIKKGQDQSEIFGLRDYVQGDSIKQIHWKLSSKRQQLIVKEPSLPIEKSLLIFWDKNTRASSAEVMNALAECVASVSQEILGQGISYTLGWTEELQLVYENIDTDDQLFQTIPRMLKHGADVSGDSGAFLYNQSRNYHNFGKVIYIAETIPEDFVSFGEADMSLVLCDRDAASDQWPVIYFDTKNYEEDLETIEL